MKECIKNCPHYILRGVEKNNTCIMLTVRCAGKIWSALTNSVMSFSKLKKNWCKPKKKHNVDQSLVNFIFNWSHFVVAFIRTDSCNILYLSLQFLQTIKHKPLHSKLNRCQTEISGGSFAASSLIRKGKIHHHSFNKSVQSAYYVTGTVLGT